MQSASDWTEIHYGVFEAHGYLINVMGKGSARRYYSFAPPIKELQQYNDMLKVTYAIGEQIPQRRKLLGEFSEPQAARDACVQHRGGGA